MKALNQHRTGTVSIAIIALTIGAFAVAACGSSGTPPTIPVGDGTGAATGTGTGTGATPDTPASDPGMASDATVLAEDGTHIQLASAWVNTTAVLLFERGHWCPFCIEHIISIQKNLEAIEALGATVVVITADAEDPPKLRIKAGATMTIYSDPDLVAIKAFGVLDAANALAVPAVVIVDRHGKIVFKRVGTNASDAVTPEQIIAELKKIQG